MLGVTCSIFLVCDKHSISISFSHCSDPFNDIPSHNFYALLAYSMMTSLRSFSFPHFSVYLFSSLLLSPHLLPSHPLPPIPSPSSLILLLSSFPLLPIQSIMTYPCRSSLYLRLLSVRSVYISHKAFSRPS